MGLGQGLDGGLDGDGHEDGVGEVVGDEDSFQAYRLAGGLDREGGGLHSAGRHSERDPLDRDGLNTLVSICGIDI